MDDLNRSISNYVKSGQYYADARRWYMNKFIYVISERTYIILIAIFFVASLAILGVFYQLTNPAQAQISYIVPSPDVARSYSVIFSAGQATDNPQLQITKYMLSRYVRKREAYAFHHIEDQLDFIKNTTVPEEYLKYQNMMSINNPSSPMMLYQEANVKEVKIQDVKILQSTPNYQQAEVYFKSSLKNLASNHVDTSDMIATIGFKIDDVATLLDTQAKTLGFVVIEYNLRTK